MNKAFGFLVTVALLLASSVARADEYDKLRMKWYEFLVGGETVNLNDSRAKKIIENINQTAQQEWDALEKSPERHFLWKDITNPYSSAETYKNFDRVRNMTLAYASKGSGLYHNEALLKDILATLDWLYANRYNERIYPFYNWWDFEVGIPLLVNDVLVLLYDQMDVQQRKNWITASRWFSLNIGGKGVQYVQYPEPYKYTGANRVWRCQVISMRGIIAKDAAEIALARDGLSPVFEYVSVGDGFYTDGSFVQHTKYAYTGGYGKSLLRNIGSIFYLLHGSSWDIKDPKSSNYYKWIRDSFEPLLYNGAMMDMVRGREIARAKNQDDNVGAGVMESLLYATQFAPEPYASEYKRLFKGWYSKHPGHEISLFNIPVADAILRDEKVTPKPELIGNWQFANMDRVVHRRPGFAVGISMYSQRIRSYELHVQSKENLKGWYTGHGMTYLYNQEELLYSNGFWATVDASRLAGTTVTRKKRGPGGGSYMLGTDWVGGVHLQGVYGVTGMQVRDDSLKLTAKKSWFMFDDEIVALGADITCVASDSVETIIENRKISQPALQQVTVNGEVKPPGNWHTTAPAPKWIHLVGPVKNSSTGYYFPQPASVRLKKETRTGSWSEWKPGKVEPLSRDYLTIWFEHGKKPQAQTYAYVLLPNKGAKQVKDYASNPDVEIVENSPDAQAVKENKLGMLGVNFWKDQPKTVGIITCNKAASVLLRKTADKIEIAVSDPTHLNNDLIEIELSIPCKKVISCDPRIKIKKVANKTSLSIDMKETAGASLQASFFL